MMPAGMVPTMISQASRSSGVSIRLVTRVWSQALMMANQSRQK